MPSNRVKIPVEEETIDCILQIPKERANCDAWIKAQPANVVADILGIAEIVHTYLKNGIYTDDTRRDQLLAHEKKLQDALEDALRQENLRVDAIHTTHNAIVEKYRTQMQDLENEMNLLKSTFSVRLKGELAKEREQHASAQAEKDAQLSQKFNNMVELLNEQLQEEKAHSQRLREKQAESLKKQEIDMKTEHDIELKALKEQCVKQVEENRRINGENALFKERVREDFDAKLEDCVKQHQQEIQLLQKQLERQEDDRLFLRTQVKEKDEEIKHMHEHGAKLLEEKTSEITAIIRNITGSTAAIGRFGEKFVNKVHAQMELGTYTDDAHIKQQGYADGTWELSFPANVENLICMVDVKYGDSSKKETQLHSQHDIKKFEDDTRAGVNMGRINCSMLLSLVKRIQGKPRLSMDTSLGVPTVWVSRDADDAIPAQSIIEMGFLMLAQAWPIISKKHNDETNINDILQAVANNLECQIIEYEKLEKHIVKIEDASKAQLRTIGEMKKIQANLLQNTHSFRIRYPAISALTTVNSHMDFWNKEGKDLIQAIKTYRSSKGRGRYYPKTIEEIVISPEIMNVIRNIPNAFDLAVKKVKDEMQDSKRVHSKVETDDVEHTNKSPKKTKI